SRWQYKGALALVLGPNARSAERRVDEGIELGRASDCAVCLPERRLDLDESNIRLAVKRFVHDSADAVLVKWVWPFDLCEGIVSKSGQLHLLVQASIAGDQGSQLMAGGEVGRTDAELLADLGRLLDQDLENRHVEWIL